MRYDQYQNFSNAFLVHIYLTLLSMPESLKAMAAELSCCLLQQDSIFVTSELFMSEWKQLPVDCHVL
jgi:hypothetical protein